SETEVKRAFRKLAFRYHPDKNPVSAASDRFQEINEAYEVLGDADKRAAYDAKLANPFVAAEPVRRTHRDPAYRRRPRPPRPTGPPQSYILMRSYLPYLLWVSRVGIIFTTLFFVDYLLPYRQQ